MQIQSGRFSIWRLIIEVFLIVLGVLLGLFLNERMLQQRNQDRAQVAIRQITDEIRYNRDQVANIADHHTAVRDSLGALYARIEDMDDPIPFQDIVGVVPGGFGVVRLQKHAWSLASELGILEYIDYSTATELSKVYDLQELYLAAYVYLSENVFLASNVRSESREGIVLGLALLANDITHHEIDLLATYDAALEQIETSGEGR